MAEVAKFDHIISIQHEKVEVISQTHDKPHEKA